MAKSNRRHANCAVAVCEADKDDASDAFDDELVGKGDDKAGSTKHHAAARADRCSHRMAMACADTGDGADNDPDDGAANQHEAIDHSESKFES